MKFVVVSILFFQCLLAGYYEDNLKFVNSYITYIQKQWNLTGGLDGGKFAPKIENLNFTFYSCEPASIEESRKMIVEVMEYILYVYNSNNDRQLNLNNYPYVPSNLEIYIKFISNKQAGTLKYVSNLNNTIYYRFNTIDRSYDGEQETFDEAYYKLRGKEWDPYKYGNTLDNDLKSCE